MTGSRMHAMLWYLTFNEEGEWRGATVAAGNNIAAAVGDAWRNGVQPGGTASGIPIPPEHKEHVARYLHVLIESESEARNALGSLASGDDDAAAG